MTSLCTKVLTTLVSSAALFVGLSPLASAAAPAAQQVELFAAAKAQQIDLKVIPKDSTQATVIIKNNTDRPLSIKIPTAFVGVPVLAQFGGGGGGGLGGGGGGLGGGGGGGQSFGGGGGGGLGGGGGGGGFGGGGGGFFDVGPGRVHKVKVATVCLEHGKKDPNPRMAYELRPITDFTDNTELHEICAMLGQGKLNQSSAQAAAWHLSDGLSFQQLANKVRVKHLNGQVEMYFNPRQLTIAMQAVQVARVNAARSTTPESQSPGEQADAEARRESLSLK